MRNILISMLVFMFFQANANAAENEITLVWRDIPLEVSMVPGDEKHFKFDEPVMWSIPKELLGIITGEAYTNNLLIRSGAEFGKTRFYFSGRESNKDYIIDITSSKKGDRSTVVVKNQSIKSEAVETDKKIKRKNTNILELTRYAFQWIYAPSRLVDKPYDVNEIRLSDNRYIKNMFVGSNVIAQPIKQWKTSKGLFATVLEITNTEHSMVDLDARFVRSHDSWVTFSLVTDKLTPFNTKNSQTTAVVLTQSPWKDASQWLH